MKYTQTINNQARRILGLLAIGALLTLGGTVVQGIVLIDPTTGNGSFEASTNSISPWSPVVYGTASLTWSVGTNPADATHGNNHLNYDMSGGAGFNEVDLNRYFLFAQPYSNTTDVFVLRFDIRGDVGPAVIFRTFQSDNATPSPIQPTLVTNSAPALSGSTYTNWYYQWKADPSWNGTLTEMYLAWSMAPGATRSLDFDNFLLYQIPEPSVMLLSGVGGLVLLWRRIGR